MNRWGIFGAWFFGAFMVAGCLGGSQSRHLSSEAEKLILRAWNTGDVASLDAVIHPDVQFNDNGRDVRGIDEYKRVVLYAREVFPDLKVKAVARYTDENTVITEWQWSGHQQGELGSLKASGRAVQVHGVGIYHFRDGIMTEGQNFIDMATLYDQLGYTRTAPTKRDP